MQAVNPLKKWMWQSALLYGLFLIPTALLMAYAGQTDAMMSRQIGGSWQAHYWVFPGLSSTASRVALDILEALAVAGLGWLFYLGFVGLNQIAIAPADEAAKQRLSRTVFGWSLLCGSLLWAVIPFHSSDLYGYLNRGFQQSVYHTNPYLVTVAGIPGWQNSPVFHDHWVYNPCPYGFFFAKLALWLTQLSDPHFLPAFLLFKGVALLALWATTALIYTAAKQLGHQRPWIPAYLFGANPLILLHVAGNGHNDILLACLLMASLCAALSGRCRWASLPLLTLSILTKYASLLALPFLLIYLLKTRDIKAIALGAGLSLLLAGGLALAYIDPAQRWPWAAMLDNAGKPQHSLVDMLSQSVYYTVKWLHGPSHQWLDAALQVLKPLFWLTFIGVYGWQLIKAIQQPFNRETLVKRIGLVMTVMIALVSAKFHPWYPAMFLPLLVLMPEVSRLRQFGLTLCLFQLAGFTVFQNLPVFSELALTVLPLWLAFSSRSPFKATV